MVVQITSYRFLMAISEILVLVLGMEAGTPFSLYMYCLGTPTGSSRDTNGWHVKI